MHYFGPGCGLSDPFTYDFTSQQLDMVKSFARAISESGDQAIAASRGEGKTTIVERLIIKYTLQGLLKSCILFQSTGTLASNSLDTIKTAITENDLLAADYPEVCIPVRALEYTPNRASYQIVSGRWHTDRRRKYKDAKSHFTWSGQLVIFPDVPGSPSAGSIIAAHGLDSAVRGTKLRGKRPQLAVIDDPDTEETARSEEQAEKLANRIDKDIAGLGSQTQPVSRILLSTIQSRISASFLFTNPKAKPSWKPRRYKFLIQPPERMDLWDDFVELKQVDWLNETNEAHEMYLENRGKMDLGAVIANPNRFDQTSESSALEHYYTMVARLGQEAVSTEYDNDPPKEDTSLGSDLTANRIAKKLSGYPRRIVPATCTTLTQGIDVQKLGVYWVIKAWDVDATNYVVDYGFYESYGTTYGSDEGLELAVHRAILGRMEQQKENPCMTSDGEIVDLNMTLVDSGAFTDTVYKACRNIGLGIYPAKGHGKSHGCTVANFTNLYRNVVNKKELVRKSGDGWFMNKQDQGNWLVHCDTDRWKRFEHERWLTADGKPGTAYLFGELSEEDKKNAGRITPRQVRSHAMYAKHIVSEAEVEEVYRGKMQRVWKMQTGKAQNHFLDASYLANVAASMMGIMLLRVNKPAGVGKRRSLADMAKGK